MIRNLQQLGRQLLGAWNQIGLNQRISIGLATGALMAGLLAIGFWSRRADYGVLYSRLDDAEAGKVISALEVDKIPYRTSQGGGVISVPVDKVHKVRMQLAGKGIGKGDIVGFEIFDRPNFGISDFMQRANYLRAVQGELARTINQLDEIESSRVMVVMPENRLLADAARKPTASVFVKLRRPGPLNPSGVNSIRFLVANAVEGLQVNNVSVVDNRGNTLSGNTEPDSMAGLSATQLEVRRQTEQYLSKKAESMLEAVLGPGRALVRVSADLSFDTMTKVQEVFEPDGTLRENTTKEEKTDTSSASAAAAAAANATTNNAVAATPVSNSKNSNVTKTTKYEVGKTTSNLVQQPGSVRRISAAVFVAKRSEGTGKDRKEVALTQKEKETLTKLVKSALGIQENTEGTRQDEITLEEWSFNEQPVIEINQQIEKQERTQFWYEIAKNVSYPGLAMAVLIAFWRGVKRTPMDSIPIGIPLGHANGNGYGRSNGNGNGNGNHANGIEDPPGVVTVDVLNQLIKENPANMTQAVRSWLTRGPSNNK